MRLPTNSCVGIVFGQLRDIPGFCPTREQLGVDQQ